MIGPERGESEEGLRGPAGEERQDDSITLGRVEGLDGRRNTFLEHWQFLSRGPMLGPE